jgi:ribosomal protein L32
MARKGRCPGCGSAMKLRHRFCTSCGRRNPLLVAPRTRAAATAAKSASVFKSAPGYAPVTDLAAARRQLAWREVLASPDPETREWLHAAYFGGDVA